MHDRPAPHALALTVTALVAGALTACTPPATTNPPAPIEPICGAGPAWKPGTPAFAERTADLGLTGVEGQRVSAVDIDGDGDADLIVRKTNAAVNDPAADPTARSIWILENRVRDGEGFVDVSAQTGLFPRPGEVWAFADVDNDGDLDAFAGVDTTNPANAGYTSAIFLNQGGFVFARADDSDVNRAGQPDFPAGAVFVDFDRDGALDLFVPQSSYGSDTLEFVGDRLYQGDGTGRFTDVTEARGLVERPWQSLADLNGALAYTRSWSGAACDVDGDGDPELLVGSYGRSPNHLWKNHAGAFANESLASGYAYDDNFTFTDNQMFACFCQTSPNDASCADAVSPLIACDGAGWDPGTDEQPFRLGGNNAAALCADLDNDGKMDVVTTTIKHWWAGSGSDASEILHGNDDGTFTRPGRDATGIVVDHLGRVDWDEGIMTGGVFDFDNDGNVDLYLGGSDYAGNRGMLFHNDGGLHFTPVDVADFFEHNRSHGIAVADFDLDGDLDVVVGHSLARCDPSSANDCYPTANVRYFENTAGNAESFVDLVLEGTSANKSAVGARVTLTSGGVVQQKTVDGGFGHFGAENELALHFGLGAACEADVTVRWPDSALTEQTFHVVAGHRFHVVQGKAPTL